jgi:hypothetical protein
MFFFLNYFLLDKYEYGKGGNQGYNKDNIKELKITREALQVMAILCVFTSFVLGKTQQR